MNSIKLYIGTELLQVGNLEEIPLTFQANNPEILESFQSNFSTRFKIPLSPNRKTLDFPDDPNGLSDFPYIFSDVRLFQNGTEIVPRGLFYVWRVIQNKFGTDEIECQLFSGNKNFFSIIDGLSIQDLDMSAYDHDFDATNIEASQSNDYTDGYIYDIYDRGTYRAVFGANIQYLSPSIFVRAIWDAIFSEAGVDYEFEDGIPTAPVDFNKLLIPFTNKDLPIQLQSEKYAKNSSGSIAITTSGSTVGLGLVAFDSTTYPSRNTYNSNLSGSAYYIDSADGSVIVAWLKITVSIHLIFASPAGGTLQLQKQTGGTAPLTGSYSTTILKTQAITGGSPIDVSFEYEGYIDMLEDTEWLYVVWIPNSLGDVVAYDSGTFDAQMVDLDKLSGTWKVSPNLPDVSQTEFVKFFAIYYGLWFDYDEYNEKVIIRTLDKILEFNNVRDWSSKIDLKKEITREFKVDGFSQHNLVKYTGDVTGYDSDIVCSDQTLELTRDFYEAPFEASEDSLTDLNSIEILNYELSGDEIGDNEAERFTLRTYKNNEANPKVTLLETGTSPDFALYDLLFDPSSVIVISNPARSTFTGLEFDQTVNGRMDLYKSILNRTHKLTLYLVIKPSDIANLDFGEVVYFESEKAYYYLYKIEQWKNERQSVKCWFYKLNEVV